MGASATATRHLRWLPAVVAVSLLLAVFLPPPPAAACSCASPTIDETVAANPDAIIAVIERIDPGGRGDGLGRVLETIHGTLPPQVPLQLDDGASCRPHVPPGSIATLTFVRNGGSFETVECGRIDDAAGLAAAFGVLEPDPEAQGPPAVALTGAFPGSELLLLDAELRVLTVAQLPNAWTAGFVRCGDALITANAGNVGLELTRFTLPDLAIHAERTVAGLYEARLTCRDDRSVAVSGRLDAPDLTGVIVPDVFSDRAESRDRIQIDDMEWAGVHEDLAYVIRRRGDRAAQITELSLGTLETRRLADVPAALYEGWVSPDGHHLAVRGFGDEPLLMTLRTEDGSIAGRSQGWWFPQGQAWIDATQLLLVDESVEFGTVGPDHRLVDANLDDIGQVPATQRVLGTTAGTLLVGGGGHRIGVIAPDGRASQSDDLRLIAANQGILLGEVTGGEPVENPPIEDPTVPRPADTSDERPAWAVIAATVVGALGVAGAGLLGWRRSRRDAGTDAPT